MDIHDFWNYEVEEVIKKYNPALIVYDMIDNIKFAGQNAGARTDQVLESMYGWARKACVKYDAIGICTSQISNEGDGLLFPTMGMLKDSKTGKQGACDFQIMIGRSNDFNSEHTRGIGIVKNKLRVDGKPGDPRAEVIFDGNRSRYRDAIN
jgi:replicative DNA helicase